ncbi:hypothetical protein Hanom_Chr04g00340911 [Helianthus anomalus]
MRELKVSYKASHHPKFTVNNYTSYTEMELATMSKVPRGMRRRDWRPSWRYVETTPWPFTMTSPNSLGRTEWRPPWFPPICNRIFSLRTSRIRVGWNDVCHETHEVMKTYQTYASHREHYHAILVT